MAALKPNGAGGNIKAEASQLVRINREGELAGNERARKRQRASEPEFVDLTEGIKGEGKVVGNEFTRQRQRTSTPDFVDLTED